MIIAKEHQSGKRVQLSKEMARKYFKLASDQGSTEAASVLAKDQQEVRV